MLLRTAVGPKGIDNDVNGQPASPAATWLATPPDAHVCQMQGGKAGAEAILNGQMQERFLCFTGVRTEVRKNGLFVSLTCVCTYCFTSVRTGSQ